MGRFDEENGVWEDHKLSKSQEERRWLRDRVMYGQLQHLQIVNNFTALKNVLQKELKFTDDDLKAELEKITNPQPDAPTTKPKKQKTTRAVQKLAKQLDVEIKEIK